MTRYEGRVSLGGTRAHATIDDIEGSRWTASVRDIETFDFQPGLVALRLLDGPQPGLFAVGELAYPEGSQAFPYREGPATVSGRTPFAPRPDAQ